MANVELDLASVGPGWQPLDWVHAINLAHGAKRLDITGIQYHKQLVYFNRCCEGSLIVIDALTDSRNKISMILF